MKTAENEWNDLRCQMAQKEKISTTRDHGVAIVMRADFRGLREEFYCVMFHAFESPDQLDGAVEVMVEDVSDLVVSTPPSSPNALDQLLQTPPPPKRRAHVCASTSRTAKKGPIENKLRVE